MPSPCCSTPRSGINAFAKSSQLDPFVFFNFTNAFKAEDSVNNGVVTTSFPSYVGTPVSLLAQGTGQSPKTVDANLNNRQSVACNGVVAAGAYGAAITPGGVGITMVSVVRMNVTGVGLSALTVGGVVNTGISQFMTGTAVRSRKIITDSQSVIGVPVNLVIVSVFTAASIFHYANRFTSVLTAAAGAIAAVNTFHLCGLSAAGGTFVLNGNMATSGFINKSFALSEAAIVLIALGTRYGVTIAP